VSSVAAPDPAAIWRVINGYSAYWVVVAGVEIGVFDHLADGAADLDALAATLSCDPLRLRVLCDALVGLSLLQRDRDYYALVPDSATFLVTGGDRSMRELLLHSPGPRGNWPAFAETIRGTDPPEPAGEEFYAQLVRATFPTQRAAAAALAPALGPYSDVLDLGAGAAPWTVGLLEHAPAARATVNDLPGVLPIAREMLETRALADRCTFVAGDFYTVSLPEHAFDVVVLAHVLRVEGPELLERAARSLRRGGRVVVADYFLDDDRRGPLNALLLGATMAAAVPGGTTYPRDEYERWLAGAGFVDVEFRSPLPFQDVMIATTPGEVQT
jgi:SAM-dependent methyltransferase